MKEEYKIELGNNYNDCGVILYDLEKQKKMSWLEVVDQFVVH